MKSNMFLLFLLSFLSILEIKAQQEVTIKTEKITDQFYVLKGRGGNIGLFVGKDAVYMIDDQFAPLTQKILAAIKTITPKNVDYLINTHWHGDHTGGNENMGKEGVLIIAHDNVRVRMSKESTRRGKKVPPAPKVALPVVTFDNTISFHINGDDVMATHIHNAHTDGDSFIYFTNNNVLHTGDSYFQGAFPYIDLGSGGSVNGYIDGLKKMLMVIDDETKIVPGHGKISNKKEMTTYLQMLTTLRDRVAKAIKNGKTLDEVSKDNSITQGFESYESWITQERIRTTIFKSLQEK